MNTQCLLCDHAIYDRFMRKRDQIFIKLHISALGLAYAMLSKRRSVAALIKRLC